MAVYIEGNTHCGCIYRREYTLWKGIHIVAIQSQVSYAEICAHYYIKYISQSHG